MGKYGKHLINCEAPRKYIYLCSTKSDRLLNKVDEESYFLVHLHLHGANSNFAEEAQ